MTKEEAIDHLREFEIGSSNLSPQLLKAAMEHRFIAYKDDLHIEVSINAHPQKIVDGVRSSVRNQLVNRGYGERDRIISLNYGSTIDYYNLAGEKILTIDSLV